MTEHERRWRQRRALTMRHQGMKYRQIATSLGLSMARAICIVHQGASRLIHPVLLRGPLRIPIEDRLPRALYILRMSEFNRGIARRQRLRMHI